MAANPFGAVWANDFGNPKVVTGVARSALSGGQLVYPSGTTNYVSSGLDSFLPTDIELSTGASGANFLGVVLQNTASGAVCPVAIDGVFLLQCASIVSGGQVVAAFGEDSVAGTILAGHDCGRALANGPSGGFAPVYIRA